MTTRWALVADPCLMDLTIRVVSRCPRFLAKAIQYHPWKRVRSKTLGTRAQMPTGYMVKHWDHSQHLTPIWPVIKCWVHFECAQPSDSNVPSGQTIGHIFNVRRNVITMYPVGKMLNIFKICLAKKVQCNQRPSIDQMYNVPCHVTLLYPNKRSGCIRNNVLNTLQKTTTFKMYPTKWSHLVQTLDIL